MVDCGPEWIPNASSLARLVGWSAASVARDFIKLEQVQQNDFIWRKVVLYSVPAPSPLFLYDKDFVFLLLILDVSFLGLASFLSKIESWYLPDDTAPQTVLKKCTGVWNANDWELLISWSNNSPVIPKYSILLYPSAVIIPSAQERKKSTRIF